MLTLAPPPADALIYVDVAHAAGGSGRALRDACRRGLLVRVRRGAYVPRGIWDELDGHQRHILAIRAAIRGVRGPFLVAGASAAALWGLPYAADERTDVTLLVPSPGGGSSEPGVRRTIASFKQAEPFEIDGIPVTGYARTVLDHARGLDFGRAVAVVDRSRWRRNPAAISLDALQEELDRARFARGGQTLQRVVNFSTDLSDSEGETRTRCAIVAVGFELPVLQQVWIDDEGEMETDYYWPSVNKAGEFDGKVKYTRAEYTRGDPSQVVWREKRREDRLRRQVDGIVRLVMDEVRRPARLAAILNEAGIPRAR